MTFPPPLTGGCCSEGLGAFRFSFNEMVLVLNSLMYTVVLSTSYVLELSVHSIPMYFSESYPNKHHRGNASLFCFCFFLFFGFKLSGVGEGLEKI